MIFNRLANYISHALSACAIFTCVFVTPAHADLKLSFGLYSSEKPTTLVKMFRPILNTLEKQLSAELKTPVSIKLSISKTYEEGIGALANGLVDFSRFGPASYIMAHDINPDILLLAMEIKNGKKIFEGNICVHSDSPIKTVADLKGKRFAFGNEESTIGRYLSQQYLAKHSIKASDLDTYNYLSRHDKVGYAVASGKYDAGAIKNSTLKKMIKSGQPLRSIASFNNVTKPWVARSGLDKKVVDAIRKALLDFSDKRALKGIRQDGFTVASEADFKSIRDAIKFNPHFFVR